MEQLSLNVEKDVIFHLDLNARPQGGFMWVLSEYCISSDIVVLQNKNIPEPGYNGLLQQFYFKIINHGTFDITFNYKRSWETHPIKSVTYSVTCI
jgi:predicted secreted protein